MTLDDLNYEDRVVILLALDTLIADYEEVARESTYSSLRAKALLAACRARDKLRAAQRP